MDMVFPFAEYWSFYLYFTLGVFVLLALDLGVFHKNAHEVSFKEAGAWTIFWTTLALLFNAGLYFYLKDKTNITIAKTISLEFFTGYLIEKTLAIDNIFVFALVFSYFAIPKKYQHRVLFWGIFSALVFRALFVAIGQSLMQYHAVIVAFGVLLIATGTKMFFAGTETQNLENNFIVKTLKKLLPVYNKIESDKFFIKIQNKVWVTPLFLALLFLEITDIIFAIDSVPAIFAITKEPMIVFTSNIFAMLGLRSMYFLIIGFMSKFRYIKYGLAGVLVFVGLKMAILNSWFDGKFPLSWSLFIIIMIIGLSIIASLMFGPKEKEVASLR